MQRQKRSLQPRDTSMRWRIQMDLGVQQTKFRWPPKPNPGTTARFLLCGAIWESVTSSTLAKDVSTEPFFSTLRRATVCKKLHNLRGRKPTGNGEDCGRLQALGRDSVESIFAISREDRNSGFCFGLVLKQSLFIVSNHKLNGL